MGYRRELLRPRYFCLAYHQDSAPSSPFVNQLGPKARSFFGHAPGCRTKFWLLIADLLSWTGQPSVNH